MKTLTEHRPNRPKWMWAAGAVGAAVIALGAIESALPEPEPDQVRLEVEADGPVSVRLYDPDGGNHHKEIDESGTWEDVIGTNEDGYWRVGVSPAFMSSTTTVTCRLYVGDVAVDEATGTGSHGSALCATE
jgi:hypothetical protein